MSVTYNTMYSLTDRGRHRFEQFMRGECEAADLVEPSQDLGQALSGFSPMVIRDFRTARDMAAAICDSFHDQDPQKFAGDIGLWCWLTAVLVDQVFPLKDGARKPGEYYRWYPAPPSDWRKAQRHLVRMPVLLYSAFGKTADHLLCGPPSVGPEIREQLTSQQDMFSRNFQEACRMLYFDEASRSVKKGSGSRDAPGTPRRLAAVRRQLDVTWDMTDLSAERILGLLPREFDAFRPSKK